MYPRQSSKGELTKNVLYNNKIESAQTHPLRDKYSNQEPVVQRTVSQKRSLGGQLFKYRKIPKFSDARKFCCNPSKVQIKRSFDRNYCEQSADGKTNSVDPDQTDLGLHCCPDLLVRKLWIIMVYHGNTISKYTDIFC